MSKHNMYFKIKRLPSLLFFIIASCILFNACGIVKLSPHVNKAIEVKKISDPSKTITVPDGMVWYDENPPAAGIRFPPGIYILEVESSDYLFFHSPEPLEFRIFKNGKPVDGKKIKGGIMFAKRNNSDAAPYAGYVNGETETERIMVWKLGKDFLLREGKEWKKSF
ncbi:hypothetical protein LPTSP3_g25370 [Leptospira kobayashii]|uniref:Lipoprotein n=2 Tax=Leptospira kobayashii TaxID=1917830 RepID=A0ABM7UKZ9_9LEPT|nr:hypothetical protein LPTSP3_g25370 [Leptospira kobayashii]